LLPAEETSVSEFEPSAQGPLEGLVVVDLTRALSGPRATWLMAGLGATVIKIEDPHAGDSVRLNPPYVGANGLSLTKRDESDMTLAVLNRSPGKHSVTLDLKKPGALDIFFDLVRRADIVVENFTAGTAERLGVGYAAASQANQRIVYCSISGFGQDSDTGVRAMDTVIQALSGLMMTHGRPGDPPIRVGIPIADNVAPLFAVIGILAALRRRDETGRGQYIDVSMLGAMTSLVATEDWEAMEQLGQPIRTGPTLPRLAPFGVFGCKDGHVAIVAPQDKMVHDLFRAIGRPDLLDDPRFSTRDGRVGEPRLVEEAVEAWTSERSVDDVIGILEAERVPVAPVRTQKEALNDPRVVERGETRPVTHPELGEIPGIRTSGVPIKFSEDTTGFAFAARGLGDDNDAVYGDLLGYGAERLAELRESGVI
jgi:crotonobetainyl-CoA:carnitine CoA-transferase CaiB-like acyl-CoA transferase